MKRRPWVALAALAAGLTSCPTVVSLDCSACDADAQCAPQGLRCLEGFCRGELSCGDDAGAQDAGAKDGGVDAGVDGGADAGSDAGPGDDAGPPRLPPLAFVPDASLVLADDFEGEPVLTKDAGGRWDRTEHDDVVGQLLAVVDGGLGNAVLSLRDTDGVNGGAVYGRFVASDFGPLVGDLFVRAHVWLKTTAGPTGTMVVAVYSDNVIDYVAAEMGIFGQASLKSGDRVEGATCARAVDFSEGAWHVVETQLLGLGKPNVGSTRQGVAALRIDGQPVCSFTRDWSTAAASSIALGSSYMEAAWQGELRFDNFALTLGAPPPARLVIKTPTPLPPNVCLPVRVELHDSIDGGLARAVRPVRLALDAGVGATFFAEGCGGPPVAVVPAGQASLVVGLRAARAGVVGLVVSDLAADLDGDGVSLVIAP